MATFCHHRGEPSTGNQLAISFSKGSWDEIRRTSPQPRLVCYSCRSAGLREVDRTDSEGEFDFATGSNLGEREQHDYERSFILAWK